MKQWQPLGGGRWWMEGSWWLCWVAAHSLSFSLSPLYLFVSLFVPHPLFSLSLPPFTFMPQSPPFPQVMSDGGRICPASPLPPCQSGCQHLLRPPLFGPDTIYRSTVRQMRVREEERETQTDMQRDGKIERDGGTDIERGRLWKKGRRDRRGSQRWLKWWVQRHCKAPHRPDQWSATTGEFVWHPYNLYLEVITLLIIFKAKTVT